MVSHEMKWCIHQWTACYIISYRDTSEYMGSCGKMKKYMRNGKNTINWCYRVNIFIVSNIIYDYKNWLYLLCYHQESYHCSIEIRCQTLLITDLKTLLYKFYHWHSWVPFTKLDYHQTSNMWCTLVVNKIVDHSDVVGAVMTVDAPTTSTILLTTSGFNGLGEDNCKTRWETFKFGDWVHLILEVWQ